MKLKLGEIAYCLGSELPAHKTDWPVERLLLDSRQFSAGSHQLFFALRGLHHDGHQHILALWQKGLRYFVGEEPPAALPPEAAFLKVDNSLQALQTLAAFVRHQSTAQCVAITGSNGKTIVKEWLWQLLHEDFRVVRSPKSYNSQVGVPLSLWELEAEHEIGIFEAGISQPGEMTKLAKMLRPQMGIFTNIGSAHGENFPRQAQKIAEKLLLFAEAQFLVYQKDQSSLAGAIEKFAATRPALELLSWSTTNRSAQLFAERLESPAGKSHFCLHWQGQQYHAQLPFGDYAARENALHALRCALALGLAPKKALAQWSRLQPVEMRLEMKAGQQNSLLINDSYNSDLESLRLALHFLETHGHGRHQCIILSDVQQSHLSAAQLSQKLSELLARFPLREVVAIGPVLCAQALELSIPVQYYPTTEQFLEHLSEFPIAGKALLLKGARRFRFEQIAARLEQKRHETVLEIQLNRLVHNLNYYRRQLAPGTRVMAMVKAFSYGSGSVEIARLLQFHGVHYLGVAYTDEGVSLRRAGIHLPIMVLNPESEALDTLIEHKLEPELYSLSRLREFAKCLQQNGQTAPYPVHLKLETGMNRLGLAAEEIPAVTTFLQKNPQLKVASVFSHLAAAEDPAEQAFTERQITRFETMSSALQEALPYPIIRHLCNSSGIERYPQAHYDMVRLGIGLYGVSAQASVRPHLQVVSSLKASISQIKTLQAGDTVSYGRRFVAQKTMRIATISIGYADGFPRSLSNGVGQVVIGGQRHPVLGSVCMDMLVVDLKDNPAREGERVEIFGDELSIYELAEKMNTIPYEVLTGISQRVKRVYLMS